jgi:AAA+ superfamily predicted ATPase
MSKTEKTNRRPSPSYLVGRSFLERNHQDRRSKVTLQHFLNCLDGIGTQDGLIVVATANDPSILDAAIIEASGQV